MNKIKAKIYFLISTGEILMITSEMQGGIEPTTKEQDMQIYDELNNKNIDDVNFIELEYGTLTGTFSNAKSYKVNLDTKQLEVTYYSQQEIDEINRKNIEYQDLNSRISDISTYLSNSDEITITNIENSILDMEKNKILEGMM